MQIIKYMGPKLDITKSGIFFKDGKEDKYVYLKTAAQILLSIDKRYKDNDNFKVIITNHDNLSDNDIIAITKNHEVDFEKHIENEKIKYEQHIKDEIKKVQEQQLITDEEKKVWINNINIMKDYMIQREINKLYYIHLIKAIKNIIKQNDIKEIDIDFSLEHWHVLSTISGNLGYGINSVSTSIKTEKNENNEFYMRMYINN